TMLPWLPASVSLSTQTSVAPAVLSVVLPKAPPLLLKPPSTYTLGPLAATATLYSLPVPPARWAQVKEPVPPASLNFATNPSSVPAAPPLVRVAVPNWAAALLNTPTTYTLVPLTAIP